MQDEDSNFLRQVAVSIGM